VGAEIVARRVRRRSSLLLLARGDLQQERHRQSALCGAKASYQTAPVVGEEPAAGDSMAYPSSRHNETPFQNQGE